MSRSQVLRNLGAVMADPLHRDGVGDNAGNVVECSVYIREVDQPVGDLLQLQRLEGIGGGGAGLGAARSKSMALLARSRYRAGCWSASSSGSSSRRSNSGDGSVRGRR